MTESERAYDRGYQDAIDRMMELLLERYENQGAVLLEDINEIKEKMED